MIILLGHATTPDELEVTSGTAADLDIHCSFVDSSDAAPPVPENPEPAHLLMTTATTSVLTTAPTSASKVRGVKSINIRNRDTADSTQVTVQIDRNSTGADVVQLHSAVLAPGELLGYEDGEGWYHVKAGVATLASGAATTAQIAAHSADTYYLGMPVTSAGVTRLKAGCFFSWAFGVTKGAAGTAAPTFNIRFGTAGTTSDASVALMTMSAQTAAADSGFIQVQATFRAVGASAVVVGRVALVHQLATTGLNSTTTGMQLVQTVGSSFNSAVDGSIIGLSVNPGTSGAWVVEAVDLDAVNLVF